MFKWLTIILLKKYFNSVTIKGEFKDNGSSVLIIANHISWWDGFWIMLLNLKVIKHRFHFMMLEEQLKKHWILQYSGGYSIKKRTRNIIESINYTIEILSHGENMVFLFPQGQIHSIYNNSIAFEKGIERIIKNISPETQVIFVVNMLDYFSDAKPNLFICIKSYLAKEFQQFNVEYEYNNFYTQVIDIQKTKVS